MIRPVINERSCAGFVLRRRHEFEAFDGEEQSLGLFASEELAIEAILKPNRK